MTPVHAAIGLGSNMGDRAQHLAFAFEALASLPGTALIARSQIIETEPVGPVIQGAYLNAAARIETTLNPQILLNHLLAIERTRGRDRSVEQRWGPRTLDLDLLLYADTALHEPGLDIPHPRLHERRFVLIPLADVWPEAVVPGIGRSVAELLRALENPGWAGVPSGR